MMKTKRSNISGIAPLFLFALFAVCAVTVLLTGAKLYHSEVEQNRLGFEYRTVAHYISMRIRQSDQADSYFIADFDDPTPKNSGNTFFSLEEHDGMVYSTRIYCHEGQLYELFSLHGADFDPRDGEPLFEVQSILFSTDGNTVSAEITHKNGYVQTLVLYPRTSSHASQEG